MKDYCKYVDVFYGNGEITEFPETGLASKWFYIKALCGNTTPHAVLPFGRMSVGAYSGGYPTGYGTHYPNSCGGIKKLWDKMKIRGFSHLHESGTGAIDYYYNYAIAVPFYGRIEKINEYYDFENETGVPGLYSVEFNDVLCRVTTNADTAFHSYKFKKAGGRLAVDFSNDGLSKVFDNRYNAVPQECNVIKKDESTVYFSGILSGIKLYFCVKAFGKNIGAKIFTGDFESSCTKLYKSEANCAFGALFDFDGSEIELKVSYSTRDFDSAEKQVNALGAAFDETAASAYAVWNKYLGAIDIETDDETLKGKFYSNLYHSLIKPVKLTGESVLGVEGETVVDFGTFWDMYKTALPLIFALYKTEGEKITKSIVNISRTLEKIPCCFGLTSMLVAENQAKMLGILTLCEGYYHGLCTAEEIDECLKRELEREDFVRFIEEGDFERYTHILDSADACFDTAKITRDEDFKAKLLTLYKNFEKAYDESGIMSENSPYYEGDRFTYSFRLHPFMEERVALSGGKEKFAKQLDTFFGFNGESLKQVTDTEMAWKILAETHHHRFEGFNNECDMETPFAYIFADRHDRLCEIVREAVKVSYKTGRGGIPGNNDSGGLSSLFVWLCLGLFPNTGSGRFLIGCPQVDGAKITLSNGKTLTVKANRRTKESFTVKSVSFNGKKIENYQIETDKLLEGGEMVFEIV